jgi:simple sugar transport system permease protein
VEAEGGMSAVLRGVRALPSMPSFTSLVTVALLAAMLLIGGAAYEGFLSLQVMLNLLIDNAFLLVIAIGMGFVILSGGIDLSVGAVLALATMISAWLLQVAHWPPLAVIAAVLLLGTLFGAGWG